MIRSKAVLDMVYLQALVWVRTYLMLFKVISFSSSIRNLVVVLTFSPSSQELPYYSITIFSKIVELSFSLGVRWPCFPFCTFSLSTTNLMRFSRLIVISSCLLYFFVQAGTPFCPLLPLIGALASLIRFAVHYRIACDTCKPPEKRWTQSRHEPSFMIMLGLTAVTTMALTSVYLTT